MAAVAADPGAPVMAQEPTAPPVGVWRALGERIAFGTYVPVPVSPDLVEERAFESRSGETYHVLKQRARKTYLSLPPEAYALWRMMDGTKPVRAIAVEYTLTHRRLVTGLLRGLVEELRAKGFLCDSSAGVFTGLAERQRRRTARYWLTSLPRSFLFRRLFELRNSDEALGTLYRSIGWVFFTRPVALAMWATLVVGLVLWLLQAGSGDRSLLKTADSYALGFGVLLAFDLVAINLHELGHALAVKHKRREVIAAGVLLYYGMPCAYVDTSDIWMADRRSRIFVSWAGPFVSLTLAGLFGIVAFASPEPLVGDLAFKASTIWFLNGLFNLVPLLELDGYFMLVDALEMPLLRQRSFTFVRQELWLKLRARSAWTREERVLGTFGLLAAAFSAATLACSAWLWEVRGAAVVTELWSLPAWYGRPLVILFALVFAGPLALGLTMLLLDGLRWAFRRVIWRLDERRLAQRAAPLLEARPYLKHLSIGERTALAAHLGARRASAGQVVVHQGDPPDGFYFIRAGDAVVERRGADGLVRPVAMLSAGDHFGELAFLTGAPRNATVRARSDLELYFLDGGHFRRWLAADMGGRAEVVRRMVDQTVLAQLPLVSDLTPSERDSLLEHVGVEHIPAGAVVFRQGDQGDKLYLIAEGRLEVLARAAGDGPDDPGRMVAELGAGDYFGEIALLTEAPRTAGIRALAPCVCYTLSRAGFARLLEAAPSRRASLDRLALERLRLTRAGLAALASDARR